MTKKISLKIVTAVGLALLMMFSVMSVLVNVHAEDAEGSLALWCVKDEDEIEGMHWKLYRVGSRTADDYVFEGAFAKYPVTLGERDKDTREWDTEVVSTAAETLRKYAIADKIPFRAEGYTDERGYLNFSGLEDGLYLVSGDVLKVDTTTYVPSAIFFEVCNQKEVYLNAYPKIIYKVLSQDLVNYKVMKVWKNDENEPWNRATFITADIFCDGELYESVVLNEYNKWLYSWEGSAAHEWFVVERSIPKNYTVSYSDNTVQYLIVNTYEVPKNSSSDDDERTTTTTMQTTDHVSDTKTSGTTITSTINTTTVTATTTSTEKLPQTGQLWWPVPLMVAGGLLLLGVGFRIGKKDKEE